MMEIKPRLVFLPELGIWRCYAEGTLNGFGTTPEWAYMEWLASFQYRGQEDGKSI